MKTHSKPHTHTHINNIQNSRLQDDSFFVADVAVVVETGAVSARVLMAAQEWNQTTPLIAHVAASRGAIPSLGRDVDRAAHHLILIHETTIDLVVRRQRSAVQISGMLPRRQRCTTLETFDTTPLLVVVEPRLGHATRLYRIDPVWEALPPWFKAAVFVIYLFIVQSCNRIIWPVFRIRVGWFAVDWWRIIYRRLGDPGVRHRWPFWERHFQIDSSIVAIDACMSVVNLPFLSIWPYSLMSTSNPPLGCPQLR